MKQQYLAGNWHNHTVGDSEEPHKSAYLPQPLTPKMKVPVNPCQGHGGLKPGCDAGRLSIVGGLL